VRIWIFVPRRGLAMVFMRDMSPFATDPWHREENQRIIEKYTRRKKSKVYDIELLTRALRKTKNYVYEFEFPQLPEHLEKRYLELCDKHGVGQPDMIERKNKWHDNFVSVFRVLRLFNPNISQVRLGKLVGKTHTTIGKWDKECNLKPAPQSIRNNKILRS